MRGGRLEPLFVVLVKSVRRLGSGELTPKQALK